MEPRTIRVFISSTFRDMNAERDYLNNIVFPQVELYCKQRFLSFIPIDLRWGIPEEYSRNGLVLSACMEEIDNSRPFFIGILGSRYGWNPKPTELNGLRVSKQQQEWIRNMSADGASITEMEMEYGVLRDMDMPYASFFIRSDKVDVPNDFREEKGSLAEKRLEKLKQRIRNQRQYPVTEYDTVQQLGDMILKQLIAMIELEYPPLNNDEADSIIEKQERILESRSRTLFDLNPTLDQFKRWISGHGRLLLITGDPGSGTSTALAYCVSKLRKLYSSKIIYFDFETLDAGVNPIDALFRFLSLKENHIPDNQWGLIAIDNTSVLGAEEEKRFVKWLNELGQNIVVAMTTTYDCDLRWILSYSFNCREINNRGLTNELKKQFIQNYFKQYSKDLSEWQLGALVEKIKSSGAEKIELLLRMLVRFGSCGKDLDNRIETLIKSSDDYSILFQIYEEAVKSFSIIKMESSYNRALICLTLVDKGIPENDLMEVADLSQTEWSIIRPFILLLCKGNSNFLRLSDYNNWIYVAQEMDMNWRLLERDLDLSKDRFKLGVKMINWYLSDSKKWKRCAQIIQGIYFNICNMWYCRINTELYETMFAVAKSPDMVQQLKDSDLANLWSCINSKNMSDNSARIYGRLVEDLSEKESITHYLRLAKAAKSLRRGKDVAYCYVEISKIKKKNEMSDADFYQYRSFLEIGHPEMTVFFVDRAGILQGERRGWLTGRLKAKYSLEQQLFAHLVMFEAFFLKGDYRNSGVEYERFREKADGVIQNASNELKEIIIKGYATFAYVFCGYYPKWNKVIAKEMIQIVFTEYMKMGLVHESTYFKYMAWACLEYQEKAYERMRIAAWWALNSACITFGVRSYQYARANLMYAYANFRLEGKYGVPCNPAYKNDFVARDYSRSFESKLNRNIEWDRIESGVKKTLLQEYEFFWNMERAIQPNTRFTQENLEKKMKDYRESIGLGEN